MRNVGVFFTVRVSRFIPKRSERKGRIVMVPLPSECRKRKVKDPAPWGVLIPFIAHGHLRSEC